VKVSIKLFGLVVEFGEIFVKPQLTEDDGYAGLSRFTLVGHGQDYSHHHGDGRGDAIVTTMKMAIMVLVLSKFHL